MRLIRSHGTDCSVTLTTTLQQLPTYVCTLGGCPYSGYRGITVVTNVSDVSYSEQMQAEFETTGQIVGRGR
jgi:hypothetical protein